MEYEGFYRVEGEGGGNPLPHLSYSRVNRYLLCPEQYRLYYVEGLRPEVESASLHFGQLIHQALAAYFQSQQDPMEIFRERWQEVKEKELRYSHRESWQTLNDRGQLLLKKFVDEEVPRLKNVTASEKPFKLNVSNLDVPFVGIIDLVAEVDGESTVIDFKTAGASYQEHEVQLSDQLSSYQLAEPSAQQLALCVLVKTKESRIEWYTTRRSAEQLQEFLQKAEIVGQQIQDRLFYKRPGKWCAWCDYQSTCTG